VRGQKQTPQKQTTPPHSYSNIPPEWSLLGPRSSWLGLSATRPSGTLKTSKPKEGMEELYTHAFKQSLVSTLWGSNSNDCIVHVPFRARIPSLMSITRHFIGRPANHALIQPTPWCHTMAMVPLLGYILYALRSFDLPRQLQSGST